MKRILPVVAALAFVLLLGAGPALATHKDGHHRPPACERSQGKAPQKNKHCYPPAASPTTSGGSQAKFPTSPPKQSGGLTVGTAAMGAVGALTASLFLRSRWVRRPRRH